jgi:hypothetical protein
MGIAMTEAGSERKKAPVGDKKQLRRPGRVVGVLALALFQEATRKPGGGYQAPEERRKAWVSSRAEYIQLATRLVTKMRKQGVTFAVQKTASRSSQFRNK